MANLPWQMLGRLLALTAGAYVAWAGLWGIFYRKFFWDMIGATLGPAGLIPPASAKPFLAVIVSVPLVQIANIVTGLITLALEWPLPPLRGTWLHSSFGFRVGFYVLCALLAMFPYQTIDGGVYYLIAAGVYAEAVRRGERMEQLESVVGMGKSLI